MVRSSVSGNDVFMMMAMIIEREKDGISYLAYRYHVEHTRIVIDDHHIENLLRTLMRIFFFFEMEWKNGIKLLLFANILVYHQIVITYYYYSYSNHVPYQHFLTLLTCCELHSGQTMMCLSFSKNYISKFISNSLARYPH